MSLRISLSVLTVVVLAGPSPAADKKPSQLREFPFWSSPKQPHTGAFVPGLQAALQLTPEQMEKIEAACRETIDKPENKGKNAPGAAAARDKLFETVNGILSADQKKLIEKVNDAYARAISDLQDDFQPQFASTKGNPDEGAKVREAYHKAVIESFEKKLDGILSNEQRAALKKAAEEAKKRTGDKKKPNK
jgi:hypothetical protein